jgi:DNA ligase-1
MSNNKYILPKDLSIDDELLNKFIKNKKFPIIYASVKKGSKEKKMFWQIKITQDDKGYGIIERKYGDIGGKKPIPKIDIIKKGKNIGKINETTPYEQAIKEAAAYFKNKLKKKYFITDKNIETKIKISPMLAFDYEKKRKHLIFPCAGQRKLDGIRCLCRYDKKNDEIILYKRSMDELNIVLFKNIRNELRKFFINFPDLWIDGEIYKHGVSLQKINVSGKKNINENEINFINKLNYNIYDCFLLSDLSIPFIKRFNIVASIFKKNRFNNLKIVKTIKINNNNHVEEMLNKFSIKENFEGIILRNELGKYELGKRSNSLLKYKPIEQNEFKIINVNKIEGDDLFRITLSLSLINGKEFMVNGNGTEEYRKKIYKNKNLYIGKYLRIFYYGITDDDIPKFAKPAKDNKSDEYIIIDKKNIFI